MLRKKRTRFKMTKEEKAMIKLCRSIRIPDTSNLKVGMKVRASYFTEWEPTWFYGQIEEISFDRFIEVRIEKSPFKSFEYNSLCFDLLKNSIVEPFDYEDIKPKREEKK